MNRAAAGAPEVFQERMEDLHRFVSKGAQEVQEREQQLTAKREFVKTLK
jgi:predicted HAD superfamily Cof-like phosphohydrolase